MSLLTRPSFQARLSTLVIQRGMKRKAKIPVTLLKDIPNVGTVGNVISVHRAYMRHQLFPKRLAEYVKKYTGPLDRNKVAEEKEQAEAVETTVQSTVSHNKIHNVALKNQELIDKLLDVKSLVFERNVMPKEDSEEGDSQALYGSLTKTDVVKLLEEVHGIVIDKDALHMDEKIKSTGEYTCVAKLMYAGQTTLKLHVVPAKTDS
ncbi:hypothetical protein GGH96_003890 [Coemansia sp. RSA 1972]|nr:hypothetical protein GGH96_003890 [Coemansia sp. RSA 1972]